MSDVAYDEEDFPSYAGCYNCGGGGWLHGCCEDMCRGSYDGEECSDARLCPICLGEGEIDRVGA